MKQGITSQLLASAELPLNISSSGIMCRLSQSKDILLLNQINFDFKTNVYFFKVMNSFELKRWFDGMFSELLSIGIPILTGKSCGVQRSQNNDKTG